MNHIYYNKCANICSKVYKDIIKHMKVEKNVNKLCLYGNSRITHYCSEFISTEKLSKAGIAFPVCISLNNITGYTDYNIEDIKETDVIKIELGVFINDTLAILGETITENEKYIKYINFLNVLQKKILKYVKHGEINDEVKINIESLCTENNCFPIENCISYQNIGNNLYTDESKYILLNYTQYYDTDDIPLTDNTCFEFEKDEVYTINLIITNNEPDKITYRDTDTCVYKLNNNFYNLKLKSSREFYNNVKKTNSNNAFYIKNYTSAKNKIGIKECFENNLIDEYIPQLVKNRNIKNTDDIVVFHKKFTIIVDKNKSILLNY